MGTWRYSFFHLEFETLEINVSVIGVEGRVRCSSMVRAVLKLENAWHGQVMLTGVDSVR